MARVEADGISFAVFLGCPSPTVAQYLQPTVAQYLQPTVAQYLQSAVAQYLQPTVAQYLQSAALRTIFTSSMFGRISPSTVRATDCSVTVSLST